MKNAIKHSLKSGKDFPRQALLLKKKEKIMFYHILYKREWEKLRDDAINKLNEQFNICPICKRMVCDNCFLICDEVDMCKSCAKILEEKGKSVSELE